MRIERVGTTKRWSDAVIYNHTLYMVEVPLLWQQVLKNRQKNCCC